MSSGINPPCNSTLLNTADVTKLIFTGNRKNVILIRTGYQITVELNRSFPTDTHNLFPYCNYTLIFILKIWRTGNYASQ